MIYTVTKSGVVVVLSRNGKKVDTYKGIPLVNKEDFS